jgi:DNA transformation protein
MAPTEGFKDFIADQLAGFGPVTIRNMFGGAGIYADGVMFGLLADDVLYLKADETSARAFAAEGMGPFTYEPDGKAPVAMSYWEVPPRLLEEPDELAQWAAEAHRIARLGKKPKPSRPRGKKTAK